MSKLVLHYFLKVLFTLFCSAVKQKHQNYCLKKKIKRDLQLRQGQIISIGKGLFESVFLFWNLTPFPLDLDMQPQYFPKGLNRHTITYTACLCAHISPQWWFSVGYFILHTCVFEYELKQILILCFVFRSLPTVFLGFCLLLLSFEQCDIKWRKERSRKW